MNYEKIYTNLILKAKKREEVDPSWADSEYTERHHWYPKSLYPEYSKEDWNVVRLTAKEHYLSHYLLHKILPNCYKMSSAFWRMSTCGTVGNRHTPNGRSFEVARKAHATAMSKFHTGKVVSTETRSKISKARKGRANNTRPVNIYCHHTDELLASNVLVRVWARSNKYTRTVLTQTARADRSKPSSVGNQHQHKGIYARYIDQGG